MPPDTRPEVIQTLETKLGYRFENYARLDRALTHASARPELGADYERLEFLGDRVLGLVIAEMLFSHFPNADQGDLSVRLNALVNGQTLAEIGEEIGISAMIRTGSDVKTLSGRKGAKVRADVMESLIATIYLDGGLDAARSVIEKHWKSRAEQIAEARRDAKTELQEWSHRLSAGVPEYKVLDRSGPDHDPVFSIEVSVAGKKPSQAVGRSKREAEQAAATQMLIREGVWVTSDARP